MTWIVTCPNWQSEKHKNTVQSWTLSPEELSKIGNRYFEKLIECRVCDSKFSLQQGVKESFSIDNPFVIHDFQFNSQENGSVEIEIGQLKKIEFHNPFENKPQIYLTPYLKPAKAVPGHITKKGFCIFSSNSTTIGEIRQIGWSAFGNREQKGIPIWRKLLSSSKEYQLSKDFRTEVVYLASAFEVFISEYVAKNLGSKLRDETVNHIINLDIGEQLKIVFLELKGKPLSKIERKAYNKWNKKVRIVRNDILHRGTQITSKQAQNARDATFDLITRINLETLDHFKIQRV